MAIIGETKRLICDGTGGREVDYDYTIDRAYIIEDDPIQEGVNSIWTIITDGEHEQGFWVPFFPDQDPTPTILLGPEVESSPI